MEGSQHDIQGYCPNFAAQRLIRALRDFNETRASDVIIVNFGAHYHDNDEDDERFRLDMGYLLDQMGAIADNATVIWR